jgi:hypothetical protein
MAWQYHGYATGQSQLYHHLFIRGIATPSVGIILIPRRVDNDERPSAACGLNEITRIRKAENLGQKMVIRLLMPLA